MPVRFTEIWVGVDKAGEFMRRLGDLFERLGYAGSGNFVFEIYGGKKSNFWMSPGYGRDSVRLNLFWLKHNPGEPERDFFPQFWALARDLDARLHWGKALDPEDQTHAERFPKQAAFLEMRQRFDPNGRFLTDYWRHHLGLEARPLAPVHSGPVSLERPFFAMRPTDEAYPAQARAQFVVSFWTKASRQVAFEAFRVDHTDWVKELWSYRPLTGPITGVGRVVDEALLFMMVRIRVVAEEPGRSWTAAVDASSLPLAERMLEKVTFEPSEGGTQVVWTVYYDPLPQIALFEPLVRPVFRALFQRMANAFKKHLDAGVAG